jgi:hypothetical protein
LVGDGLRETVAAAWGVGVTSRPQPVIIVAAIIHQINLDTIRPPSKMRADYTTIKLDIKNLT